LGQHDKMKAVVTGAADGIGKATVQRLLAEGASVLAVDIQGEKLEEIAAAGALILVQDITAENAAQAIAGAALDKLGGTDFLVNIAGVVGGSTIEQHDDGEWNRVLNINLHSVYQLSKIFIPLLKKSVRGRIVNIGSVMSTRAGAGMGAYTTSKHAVAGITKTLALELGADGITANYIQPGAIVTGITRPVIELNQGFAELWAGKAALGRLGQPEDIANGINFLLSEDASFITGHGLVIDGGVLPSV
jgi:NAD(P)-dependent dehydrogenase (short-subunit alcohol dehydrogenase family)